MLNVFLYLIIGLVIIVMVLIAFTVISAKNVVKRRSHHNYSRFDNDPQTENATEWIPDEVDNTPECVHLRDSITELREAYDHMSSEYTDRSLHQQSQDLRRRCSSTSSLESSRRSSEKTLFHTIFTGRRFDHQKARDAMEMLTMEEEDTRRTSWPLMMRRRTSSRQFSLRRIPESE